VPDSLYLSLWFPSFGLEDMLPRTLAVMRQFPFSSAQPGIGYASIHPVSWSEPTILEQRFRPPVPAEQAVLLAADLLHEDYAYLFDAAWDLWVPVDDRRQWSLEPRPAEFLVHGAEFDDGAYAQKGNIEVDLGLDSPFLQEDVQLTSEAEIRVRANVQKLVEFTSKAEKASGASRRLLWSESEENFAQKLVARLQKVQ